MDATRPRPLCAACGRPIERAARDGAPRTWCSRACAARRIRPVDRRLEALVLELLDAGGRRTAVTPGEVADTLSARGAGPTERPGGPTLEELARRAIRRLAAAGRVEVLQAGRRVDAATARGPIAARRRPASD